MAIGERALPVGVEAAAMTGAEAKRLTADIRRRLGDVGERTERLRDAIHRARREGAWRALGYATWTAYVEAEFPQVSRDRSYRLAQWGAVERELAEAAGGPVGVSGREAVRVAPAVGSVAERVRGKLAGIAAPSDADRRRAVTEAIGETPGVRRARHAKPARGPQEPPPRPDAATGLADPERPGEDGQGAADDQTSETAAGVVDAAQVEDAARLLIGAPGVLGVGLSIGELDGVAAWVSRTRVARGQRPA